MMLALRGYHFTAIQAFPTPLALRGLPTDFRDGEFGRLVNPYLSEIKLIRESVQFECLQGGLRIGRIIGDEYDNNVSVSDKLDVLTGLIASKPDHMAVDFMPLQQLAGKLFPACSEVENA